MRQQSKILLLGLLCAVFTDLRSETIEVCANCPAQSLADAIQKANPYDTLKLSGETYEAVNLEITKPLTLLGAEGSILNGKKEGYIIKILSDSVNVSGLKLINCGQSYTKDFASIYVSRVQHYSIKNCELVNPHFGILVEKSHHGEIVGNYVHGSMHIESEAGNGIHLWHCSNAVVEDNKLSGMRDGIYFEFVTDSQISRNLSYENIRYGLHFMFSNNDEYRDNEFRNNGAGVAVMFSKFIVMENNTFMKNWGTASYGLLLKEIYDAEVLNNTFDQNTIAIFLEGSTRINYKDNDFLNNGWAVKVSGGCYTNIFSQNNFISNALDVSYNSKMNDNAFHGNYWSEYTGYDLDRDGLGDAPYRPVKLFSYIVSQTPESIVLLRSLFIDILNFSEKVSPIFTPDNLLDDSPAMNPY